ARRTSLPNNARVPQVQLELHEEHGVKAFYEMTDEYVSKLLERGIRAKHIAETEKRTGKPAYWELFKTDLEPMEAPMHCCVCFDTIANVHYAADILGL